MHVICLGELIIDFTSLEPEKPLWKVGKFQKNVGGAPANVAVGLHHHSVDVSLWSQVGNDSFGEFLIEKIRQIGVDTSGILIDKNHSTKLAFVGLDRGGDRYFEFHNAKNSAEQYIAFEKLPLSAFDHARVFHFGGVALLGDVTWETTRKVLKIAKTNDCIVSFDPNIRIDLMKNPDEILARFRGALKYVDILKLSEADQSQFFSGQPPGDILAAGPSLLMITVGEKGAHFYTHSQSVGVPAKPVNAVDTTGAGDAFLAAFLAKFVRVSGQTRPDALSREQLETWGKFAGEWAGKIVARRGAIAGYIR